MKSADEVIAVLKKHKCRDVVVVLPVNLLADLTEKGVQPIRAFMSREIPAEGGAPKFEHRYFNRVKSVKIEEERIT